MFLQYFSTMCSSTIISIFPHGGSVEVLRGMGVAKAEVFKEKYWAKLQFLEGWGRGGTNLKNPSVGSMVFFWNHATSIWEFSWAVIETAQLGVKRNKTSNIWTLLWLQLQYVDSPTSWFINMPHRFQFCQNRMLFYTPSPTLPHPLCALPFVRHMINKHTCN